MLITRLGEDIKTAIKVPAFYNHNHIQMSRYFIALALTERLQSDARFTGRGVRIAFLDSGFYPHDDLKDRIVRFHDVTGEDADALVDLKEPQAHHWHGTQTTVVAAGDGKLSEGTYRGIASGAELVLVKVRKRDALLKKISSAVWNGF